MPRRGATVVIVPGNAFDHAQGFFGGLVDGGSRGRKRSNFHVVTHTVVHREFSIYAPTVLEEKCKGQIVEGTVGIADALNVSGGNSQAVGLQRRQTGHLRAGRTR